MDRSRLPLNALRAFEAAARHLNVTRAALELRVTQAAVSHHIKLLEEQLGVPLFRRLPRGLVLTDEGAALVPMLKDTFDRMAAIAPGWRARLTRDACDRMRTGFQRRDVATSTHVAKRRKSGGFTSFAPNFGVHCRG